MPVQLKLPFSGDRLQVTREKAGLSRAGLATRCRAGDHSVTPQHIRRLEIGESKPSAPLLKALATALNVKIDDLLAEAS